MVEASVPHQSHLIATEVVGPWRFPKGLVLTKSENQGWVGKKGEHTKAEPPVASPQAMTHYLLDQD